MTEMIGARVPRPHVNTVGAVMLAALVDLGGRSRVIKWGWFRLTVANFVAFLVLGVVLVVAAIGRLRETGFTAESERQNG
jgi:hypothetical protein